MIRVPSRPARLAPLAVLLAAALAFAADVPFLAGRVNDTAGMIPAAAKERIEAKLLAFERGTTNQFAVLTVETLDGDPIDDFSMRVAETWKLGAKGKDNGVLLVVAKAERKMRLEVGYGLEGTLTDAMSSRILDSAVRPRFKAGDFGGGVEAGVDAVIAVLEGREPPEGLRAAGGPVPVPARLTGLAIFCVVVGVFSLVALFGPGVPGWFLYLFLLPFYGVFPSVLVHPKAGVAAAVLWLFGFPVARTLLHRTGAGRSFLRAHPDLLRFGGPGGRGGWGGGLGSGGWGGGGGFSGGGGSFGGGGASGGW